MAYSPRDLVAAEPQWHFVDFERQALQISYALQARKTRCIALWLEDAAHLACVLLGAWHARVRVLFVPNCTAESIEWANEFADFWITDTEFTQSKIEYFETFAQAINMNKIPENRPLFDRENETEIWLKTSGSTGKAKTIVKTAKQMWLAAEAIAAGLGYSSDNRVTAICTVSIQHIYGLTVHIMMSLVMGWQISRKQQFYPECMLAEADKTAAAVIISSPAMLMRMDWAKTNIPAQINSLISSGGPLAESTATEIRLRLQKPVIEIYGSTETGPIAWRRDSRYWQIFPDSRVGADSVNETLWIEAPWIKGREQTADVVELKMYGFALLGRHDRIVKIADKRTSLAGIENALMENAYIKDCYIAMHPEQPRTAAWVELNADGIQILREQGRRALIRELKQCLIQTQESAAIPRFWRLTHKLPRNSQSKINKSEFDQICLEPQVDPIWGEACPHSDGYTISGRVPLDLVFLKDHFANFPLVPGVVELQWITDNIRAFFPQPIRITCFDKLKYQHFLRPNDCFEISLKWEKTRQRMAFQLTVEKEICCSGFAAIKIAPLENE